MPTDPPSSMRTIGRTDRAMPPVVWQVCDPAISFPRDNAWVFLPQSVDEARIAEMRQILEGAHVILGMEAGDFSRRSSKPIDARLDALGRETCDAILLQNVAPADVKDGRIFHRAAQLRQRGRVDLCFVEAQSHADAEWLIRHTPAQGVMLDFGLGDQTARYRILPEAAEIGTAVLARRPRVPIWSVQLPGDDVDRSFVIAHEAVTAVIEPLPPDPDEGKQIMQSLTKPMPDEEVNQWWERFRAHVPEPPKPRGAHPPEWA